MDVNIDRRRLLQLGLTLPFLAKISTAFGDVDEELVKYCIEYASGSVFPLDPEATGLITDPNFETIFRLCKYVDSVWVLNVDLSSYMARLRSDLRQKTENSPSYLTEYISVADLITRSTQEMPDDLSVFSFLLFSDFSSHADFASSRLGRARAFVFSELIRHQVAMAGFRSFGLENYQGYFGGPYTAPGSYRKLGQ